jgi:hypothetical protein
VGVAAGKGEEVEHENSLEVEKLWGRNFAVQVEPSCGRKGQHEENGSKSPGQIFEQIHQSGICEVRFFNTIPSPETRVYHKDIIFSPSLSCNRDSLFRNKSG